MAAVEVTITGMLYDKLNRTTQNVVLIGEASLTGVGIGGGPIIPPGGGSPPGIWGPTDPRPSNPIAGIPGLPGWDPGAGNTPPWGPTVPPGQGPTPPGIWGPNDPRPSPPIFLPPNCPPSLQPPTPPAGSGGWPVQPIAIPDYMVVWYPGVGPVVVAPPAQGAGGGGGTPPDAGTPSPPQAGQLPSTPIATPV